MPQAIGSNIDIGGLSKAIKDADNGLKNLQKTSDNVTKSINKAFESVAQGGVQQLSQTIEALNKGLQNLGKSTGSKGVTKAMEDISHSASKAIDDVNRVSESIQGIASGAKQNNAGAMGLEALGIQKEKIRQDILEAKEEFKKLQKEFTHLSVPAGDKTILSNIQGQAQFNMAYTEMLKKQEQVILNAQKIMEYTQKTATQKDPFKAKIDDLSGESLEARRYKDAMAAMREFYIEQDRQAKENEQKRLKEIHRESQERKKAYQAYITSTSGSMRFADKQMIKNPTIDNLQKAISNLEQAQRRVNTSTKEGRKEFDALNLKLAKTRAKLAEVTGETNAVARALGPVGRAIATAFSVHAIRGYVNKMVEVRKEMERQEKALQIIIGNKEQANRIWDQTIELAIKSPFTIQELTRYTRQLAAYRVETGKLYETNKMLADVSAGLGVDMNRLILAFGQVKAASYLRGTELRQFTEAGIPMLEELAKHFTELQGRIVTVDQAFDMISKRQVEFKDVEQVFKNMTSEGGVFFNMQEEMSNTIHGKISNLKDSISVMLNEIGQSQEGTIYSALSLTKTLVDNWRYVAAAIKAVVAAYMAYQAVTLVAAIRSGALATAFYNIKAGTAGATAGVSALTGGVARAGVVFQRFGRAIKAHPLFAIVSIITTAIASIKFFSDASEEAHEDETRRQEEMEQNIEQLRKKSETLTNSVLKLKEAFKDAVDSKNITDQKLQLQKLIDIANEEYRMKIVVDVEGLTPEEMAAKMLEVGNSLEQISSIATVFATQMEKTLGDKLVERSAEITEAVQDLLSIDAKSISKLIGRDIGIKENENTEDYINRLLDVRAQSKRYNEWVRLYNQSLEDRDKYEKWQKDASGKEYLAIDPNSYWAMPVETQKQITAFGKMAVALDEYKIELPKLQEEFNSLLSSLNTENAQTLGLLDESIDLAIRQFASQKGLPENYANMLIQWANDFYGLDIDNIPKKSLQDWQIRFNQYLEELRKTSQEALEKEFGKDSKTWSGSKFDANGVLSTLPMFDESNADKNRKKMKEQIKGQMDTAKEIIDTFEKGIEGAGAYTEAEYKLAQIEYEQLTKAYEFFGGSDKGEAKSAKKRLQEQIKLLEDMHKKYLDLKKPYGDEKAESEVRKAYSDTFAEVFKGTDISFDAYKTFGGFVDAASDAGAEAGAALTEEMQAKIDRLTEKGIYIRDLDDAGKEASLEFIKGFEGSANKAYQDIGSKKWAIGIGNNYDPETRKEITKDTVWSDEEIIRKNKVAMKSHMDALNKILDVHKDIIVTEEQYMALLDLTWQTGGAAALGYSKDRDGFKKWLEEIDGMPIVQVLKDGTRKQTGIFDIDVDKIVADYDKASTAVEKAAIAMEYVGIRNKKDKDTTESMIKRGQERAKLFKGDLDIAQQLYDALVTMEGLDFMTKEGMAEALQNLKDLAKKAGPEVEKLLSKTISGYEAEIGIKTAQDADKKLQADVQDLFDRHKLTIELKKLQVPPTVAKNLFGVDFLDNAGLKSEVIETYTKNLTGETKKAVADELAKGVKNANWTLVAKELGDTQIDQIKKDIEKVDDLEEKALKDRMKKYVEYSRKSLDGAGKIRLEQLQKRMDIEDAFKPKEGDSEEVKATKAEEKARALNRATEEANEAMMKLQWEEFRKSETFTSLFDDLDTASDKVLEDVIARLEEFKKQWRDLPVDQMKEVDALLRKAKRAKDADDSPWAAARDLRASIKSDGRTADEAAIQSAAAEQEKARLEEELRMMELINQQRNLGTTDAQLEIVLGEKYKHLLKETFDIEKQKGKIAKQQGVVDNAQDRIQDQKDLIDAYEAQADEMKEIDKMAQDLYGSFKELYEAMGQDDAWAVFADAGMEMSSMVLNTIALQAELNAARVSAEGFGLAMNTAMGVIGWIVMGIQLLTKAITAVAEYEDKLIEQEVEKQTRAVEDAIKAYEALEEAMEDVYSTEQIREYSRQMDAELQKAIDAQEAIIKARKSAKHSGEVGHEDWEALKEAEEALEELEKRHEENLKSMTSTLTDGILDSVHDAAREFTDAWYEAFKETGDGLSGLEENFEEMFMNLAKNQAAMQITDEYVKMWQKSLKDYIDVDKGDTEITPEEAAEWANKVKASFPQLSEALEAFLGVISDGLGTTASGGLSALQKGIQGVTEETAQVLEALLNSMRDTQANAYLELQAQTKVLRDIYSLLNNLTSSGSSMAINSRMRA